jgi:hypothetical protein
MHGEELSVSQGSVLFSFLFSVYIHDFDLHMTELIKEKKRKSIKVENREYVSERQLLSKELYKKGKEIRLRAVTALKKNFKRKGIQLFMYQVASIRLNYIRYGNDFLVGFKADK